MKNPKKRTRSLDRARALLLDDHMYSLTPCPFVSNLFTLGTVAFMIRKTLIILKAAFAPIILINLIRGEGPKKYIHIYTTSEKKTKFALFFLAF